MFICLQKSIDFYFHLKKNEVVLNQHIEKLNPLTFYVNCTFSDTTSTENNTKYIKFPFKVSKDELLEQIPNGLKIIDGYTNNVVAVIIYPYVSIIVNKHFLGKIEENDGNVYHEYGPLLFQDYVMRYIDFEDVSYFPIYTLDIQEEQIKIKLPKLLRNAENYKNITRAFDIILPRITNKRYKYIQPIYDTDYLFLYNLGFNISKLNEDQFTILKQVINKLLQTLLEKRALDLFYITAYSECFTEFFNLSEKQVNVVR